MPLPWGWAWAGCFPLLVPVFPTSAECTRPSCFAAGTEEGVRVVAGVGLGLGFALGMGGRVGGAAVCVGRGLGNAGTGGRAGATGAVGVTGSKSIGVSSCNSQRFTTVATRPRGSREEGGTGEGKGEAKGPSRPMTLQRAERVFKHSLMAWLQ